MALREARREDIRRIVEMLADDDVSRGREDVSGDMAAYHAAFDAIAADANNTLYVWDEDGAVMGCLQLTFLPGLSYRGSLIAQVEGVRVDRALRGRGIGEKMMAWSLRRPAHRGCKHLQTSPTSAVDARRFYARIGFAASHEGISSRGGAESSLRGDEAQRGTSCPGRGAALLWCARVRGVTETSDMPVYAVPVLHAAPRRVADARKPRRRCIAPGQKRPYRRARKNAVSSVAPRARRRRIDLRHVMAVGPRRSAP